MAIQKIIIDNSTQAKLLGENKIQLNLVAHPLNEGNQKEPDAEFKLYVNNQLLQNITSDLQGNINESLVINGNNKEIVIKLQDISSGIVSNIRTILLAGTTMLGTGNTNQIEERNEIREQENTHATEKMQFIAKIKLNPSYIYQLPPRARDDSDIVKYAVEQWGAQLMNVGEICKNNKELVLIALRQDIGNFNFASATLQTDEDFALQCIKEFGIRITGRFSNYMRSLPRIQTEINKANDQIEQFNNNQRQMNEKTNKLNRIIDIDKEISRLKDDIDHNNKRINALSEVKSLQKERLRISTERTQASRQQIDHHGKIAELYSGRINTVQAKLQKHSELLGNLVSSGCPSETNIMEYENYCKNNINQNSILIKEYELEKKQITN